MNPKEELLATLHRFSFERNALKALSKKLLETNQISKEDYVTVQDVLSGKSL